MHYFTGVVIPKEKIDACCVDCAVEASLSPFCDFGCDEDPNARMRDLKERGVQYKEPKWDWYGIGGRYIGRFSGFDPMQDPGYQETCLLCRGSGRAMDPCLCQHQQLHHGEAGCEKSGCPCRRQFLGECPDCEGRGKRFSLPALYTRRHDGDVWPIAELLSRGDDDWVPFAVVTPEGDWVEMPLSPDWTPGSNPDPELQKEWTTTIRQILQTYVDHFIVAVDCHQ